MDPIRKDSAKTLLPWVELSSVLVRITSEPRMHNVEKVELHGNPKGPVRVQQIESNAADKTDTRLFTAKKRRVPTNARPRLVSSFRLNNVGSVTRNQKP